MENRYGVLAAVLAVLIAIMAAGLLFGEGTGSVAVIPVNGMITAGDASGLLQSQVASSTRITRWLEDAGEDESIDAVLLEINSPGGSAVASDEIAQAVDALDKPVVAWIRESGASGAYWIASEADHVIANRMSITGSVGVIASYLSFGELLEEHNVTYQRLVAGRDKDIGSPYTPLSDRQEHLLQEKLDTIHTYFLDDVQANRNLTDEQRERIDSGIFYLGSEAQQHGLVDELGTRQEVHAHLQGLLGEEPTYRRYEPRRGALEELFGITLPASGWKLEAR